MATLCRVQALAPTAIARVQPRVVARIEALLGQWRPCRRPAGENCASLQLLSAGDPGDQPQ